jgi:hypothetical protein
VVVVATPANLHLATVRDFAATRPALFIEKPLTTDVADADALITLRDELGLVTDVGYCLRSSPSLRAFADAVAEGVVGRPLGIRSEVGQALEDWRPGTDPEQSVSVQPDLGGGVVFELSHELDYLSWILGPPTLVAAACRTTGSPTRQVEDSAELVLGWGELLASVHLDMVRRPPTRSCTLWGEAGVLTWDGIGRTVTRVDADGAVDVRHPPGEPADEMYRIELAHFLDCVDGRANPTVTLEEARSVVELCVEARRSGSLGRSERGG